MVQYLQEIPDFRRAQGRRFELHYILLFSLMATLSGATSYRDIQRFIQTHFELLQKVFFLKWKRPPGHVSLRTNLMGVRAEDLEKALRSHSLQLLDISDGTHIAVDGKALRGSADHLKDKKALHLLSAFATNGDIILAHLKTDDKSNEIKAFQKLLTELKLKNVVYTLDAMHCQKKLLNSF